MLPSKTSDMEMDWVHSYIPEAFMGHYITQKYYINSWCQQNNRLCIFKHNVQRWGATGWKLMYMAVTALKWNHRKAKKNNFMVNYYQVTLIHHIYKCALAAEKNCQERCTTIFFTNQTSLLTRNKCCQKKWNLSTDIISMLQNLTIQYYINIMQQSK